MDAMERYVWPGNVRELKNVVERAVAHWPDTSRPIDQITFDPFASPYRPTAKKALSDHVGRLPEKPGEESPSSSAVGGELPSDFKAAVAAFETDLLTRALEESRHNQRVAARRLGLGYHQFRNALRKHGLLPARSAQ